MSENDSSRNDIPEQEPTKERADIDKSAIRKKKSIGRKLMDRLFSDDPIRASERVKNEVIWPGLKELGYNILMSGLSMMFWGEVRGGYSRPGSRSQRNERYEDYSRYSDSSGGRERPNYGSRRPSYDYGEIIFRTKEGADGALKHLRWCIDRYGQASVADLNGEAELSSKYTDHYYGWFDLRNSGVYPTPEGWVIDLPPTEPIKIH